MKKADLMDYLDCLENEVNEVNLNIWNNPEQHHQKPRQAYQKCLFIPSTVF